MLRDDINILFLIKHAGSGIHCRCPYLAVISGDCHGWSSNPYSSLTNVAGFLLLEGALFPPLLCICSLIYQSSVFSGPLPPSTLVARFDLGHSLITSPHISPALALESATSGFLSVEGDSPKPQSGCGGNPATRACPCSRVRACVCRRIH